MKTELLIVADRAHLKVYTFNPSNGRQPALHLEEDFMVDEARDHFADQFTDQAGSFPNRGTNGQGMAERMSLAAETEARSLRKLAIHLEQTVHSHHPQRWSFAAPARINQTLLNGLTEQNRQHLVQNIPKDLVNQPPGRLMSHFR